MLSFSSTFSTISGSSSESVVATEGTSSSLLLAASRIFHGLRGTSDWNLSLSSGMSSISTEGCLLAGTGFSGTDFFFGSAGVVLPTDAFFFFMGFILTGSLLASRGAFVYEKGESHQLDRDWVALGGLYDDFCKIFFLVVCIDPDCSSLVL